MAGSDVEKVDVEKVWPLVQEYHPPAAHGV